MPNRERRRTSAALWLMLGLAVISRSTAALADEAVRQGARLAQSWCSACHAVGAGSTGSDIAPTFAEIAERRSPDYVRGFLANPHARGRMPTFDLSNAQIEDVVRYIYRDR